MQIDCVVGNLSAEPLQQAHSRVLSMSMIHEHLYMSEDLSMLDFGQYIRSLATSLFEAYCIDPVRIQLDLATEPILLPVDDAIACGLILNELLSNSLKHAFKGGRKGGYSCG
jgi:two-component sensor histidine kinase